MVAPLSNVTKDHWIVPLKEMAFICIFILQIIFFKKNVHIDQQIAFLK